MEASLSTTYNAQAIVNACRRPRETTTTLKSNANFALLDGTMGWNQL